MRHAIASIALVIVVPALLSGQPLRTFDAARQARDSTPITAHVSYGAGRVRVQPATGKELYDVHMQYNPRFVEPHYSFNTETRLLDVGIRKAKLSKGDFDGEGNELHLRLARSAPLRLQLDVGAAEGDYDLSGLQLEELILQTGASDSRVRFETPNPRRLRTLRVSAGAAGVELTGLGNANVERVDLSLGVGSATLDFSGEWRGDVEMTVQSALGKVTLRIPNDVGIRVETSSFLHSLDAPGLTKHKGYSVSSNWETAKYKIRVQSSGAFGQLEIQRSAR